MGYVSISSPKCDLLPDLLAYRCGRWLLWRSYPLTLVLQKLTPSPTSLDELDPAARQDEARRLMAAIADHQDRDAFGVLFDYFAPRLKSFALKRGCDEREAEEIAQETMITLWRKAGSYQPDRAQVSTWLFRIARNRHIDLTRRAGRRVLDEDDPSLRPEAEPQPDDYLASREREDAVRAALNTLPQRQLELLRLAFFDGLTHAEIAERTRTPMGTVKSRMRLAYQKLRAVLDPND